MTTTTAEVTRLTTAEIRDLGIEPHVHPDEICVAFRDGDVVRILVLDQNGVYHIDDPSKDCSGEDAWEWIEFGSGRERDAWIGEHFHCAWCDAEPGQIGPCTQNIGEPHDYPDAFDPETDFWIERYEHGLVRYAPIGESSAIDRQWDVAPGVAILRFLKPDDFGHPLIEVARSICNEYTEWCNGNCYGVLEFERVRNAPKVPVPGMVDTDFDFHWVETDGTVWGLLGDDWAEQVAKEGY